MKINFNIKKSNLFTYIIVCIYFLFNFWTTTSSNNPINFSRKSVDYYNNLVDSFCAGKTYFLKLPSEQLLALKDPYDPIANAPYRFHDVSLYKSKYYLYFGTTPVLTLLLPFKVITGLYFPINLACLIYGSGVYYLLIIIVNSLCSDLNIKVNKYIKISVYLILAFATQLPILMRWANIYELAIICSMFYMLLGVYLCIIIVKNDNYLPVKLTLFSISVGLSIASRPNQLFAGFLIVSYITLILLNNDKTLKLKKLFLIVCVLSPILIIGLILMFYNYIRFNNILEFGGKYQLAGVQNLSNETYGFKLDTSNFISTFKIYILEPLGLQNKFPYFSSNYNILFKYNNANFKRFYSVGPNFSLIYTYPLYFFNFIFILFVFIKFKFNNYSLKLIYIVNIMGVLNILIFSLLGLVAARYYFDFAPLLIIANIVMLLYLKSIFTKILQYVFNIIIIVSSFYTCIAIVGLSISGDSIRGLQYQNPEIFNKLSRIFKSNNFSLKQIYNLRVSFPFDTGLIQGKQKKLIFKSGQNGFSDNLYIENVGNDHFVISYKKYINRKLNTQYLSPNDIVSCSNDTSSLNEVTSNYFDINNRKLIIIRIEYTQMTRQLMCYVNDNLIFNTKCSLFPSSNDNLYINYNRDVVKNIEINTIYDEPSIWYPRL